MIDINKTKRRIRDRCKSHGVAEADIADACSVSLYAVNQWLYRSNNRLPSLYNMVIIASLIGCSVDDLIVLKCQ